MLVSELDRFVELHMKLNEKIKSIFPWSSPFLPRNAHISHTVVLMVDHFSNILYELSFLLLINTMQNSW